METALWAGGITFAVIAVFLLWLGLRAQKKPGLTGDEAMIGETGIVRKISGFRGRLVVEVRGELWWSSLSSETKPAIGSEVKVTAVDPRDLILIVEPIGRK
ncbi:hypothetical protein CSA37_06200 [Candidatus Fermentibacteria bacterium]|nr:MAG: hypothetical protein CSA37_06200 [Candidatus Fermentibacteria bacterium]